MALFIIRIPGMVLAIGIAVISLIVVTHSEHRHLQSTSRKMLRPDVVSPTATEQEEPAVPAAA
jgi:hypothetical protein